MRPSWSLHQVDAGASDMLIEGHPIKAHHDTGWRPAMARGAILALVLVLLTDVFSFATTAQSGIDERTAAQVAVELSYLESIGDFNALYDRIHPDAHALVPRAAVIGWYQNEFYPLGPGVATVTGVRFVQWTWPVNGSTYSYTAEVSFVQPFADGTVLEDVVRLVQDDLGEWRWFFGRSREFVEEQIARYVPQPQVGGSSLSILDVAINDLDVFWALSFEAAGRRYVAPRVVEYGPGVTSNCGFLSGDIGPAAYCGDGTVYYDLAWLSYVDSTFGDFAWVTILAHEWGHHVQNLEGIRGLPPKLRELQADCLAGAYARDAETRGLLDPGDVSEAVAISARSGDPMWLPEDAEGAHGTSDERVAAFMRGYLDGFIGCGFMSMSSSPSSTLPVSSSTVDITSLLPLAHEVPPGLVHVAEANRTLSQVTVGYRNPAETAWLFQEWGWRENVTRTYEAASSENAVQMVYVSIHQFGDDRGAANALDYSFQDQMSATGAWEMAPSPIAATTRALVTDADVTIYARQGNLLIRLTVEYPTGDPLPIAESILSSMVARAA